MVGCADQYAVFDEGGLGRGRYRVPRQSLDPTDEGKLEIDLLPSMPALYSTVSVIIQGAFKRCAY